MQTGVRECLCANPTVQQDRGYCVTSALALAVEAAEALSTFLSTVTLA